MSQPGPPPWLENSSLAAELAQMRKDINEQVHEVPILIANLEAGNSGPLFDPTARQIGWGSLLVAPNPTTRDELVHFTGESLSHNFRNS